MVCQPVVNPRSGQETVHTPPVDLLAGGSREIVVVPAALAEVVVIPRAWPRDEIMVDLYKAIEGIVVPFLRHQWPEVWNAKALFQLAREINLRQVPVVNAWCREDLI